MGVISNLLGGGAASVITSVADAVDKYVETPDEKAAHELKEKALDLSIALKQIDLNTAEAQHRSVWVAGWRPAVGWICAAALGYSFIVQPLLGAALAIFHPGAPALPSVDLAGLWPVLLGMLGLGGLRTYEKQKGVTK